MIWKEENKCPLFLEGTIFCMNKPKNLTTTRNNRRGQKTGWIYKINLQLQTNIAHKNTSKNSLQILVN